MQKKLKEEIKKAVEILKNGGVIVYPTETFYAIGCDPFNKKALSRIINIKCREKGKPFPLIAADEYMVEKFAFLDENTRRLIAEYWPGPLTVLLRERVKFPSGLIALRHKIAIRVSSNPVAKYISMETGNPVVATSANISGEKPFIHLEDVVNKLGNKINLYINGGALKGEKPSTIVDCSGKTIRVIRSGAIILKNLENYQKK